MPLPQISGVSQNGQTASDAGGVAASRCRRDGPFELRSNRIENPDGGGWCGKSEEPPGCSKFDVGRSPEDDRNSNQTKQASPNKGAARLWIYVRIFSAGDAFPVLPTADGQDRDPEDVSDIEGSNGDGAPGRLTRQAIVIAKCNRLWPEMVGAVDDEHGASSNGSARYISATPHGRK